MAEIIFDCFPIRRIADIVRDSADAIDADEKVDVFELLPVRNYLWGKDRAVGVIAQPNVMSLADFAARLYKIKLFLDKERLAPSEDDFFHVGQKGFQVLPECCVSVPFEAAGIDH